MAEMPRNWDIIHFMSTRPVGSGDKLDVNRKKITEHVYLGYNEGAGAACYALSADQICNSHIAAVPVLEWQPAVESHYTPDSKNCTRGSARRRALMGAFLLAHLSGFSAHSRLCVFHAPPAFSQSASVLAPVTSAAKPGAANTSDNAAEKSDAFMIATSLRFSWSKLLLIKQVAKDSSAQWRSSAIPRSRIDFEDLRAVLLLGESAPPTSLVEPGPSMGFRHTFLFWSGSTANGQTPTDAMILDTEAKRAAAERADDVDWGWLGLLGLLGLGGLAAGAMPCSVGVIHLGALRPNAESGRGQKLGMRQPGLRCAACSALLPSQMRPFANLQPTCYNAAHNAIYQATFLVCMAWVARACRASRADVRTRACGI